MKKTLRQEIEELKRDVEYHKNKNEAKDEIIAKIKREDQNRFDNISKDRNAVLDSNRQLMEVIRWMTNPETAKYPFAPEKGQIDPNNSGRRFY